MTAVLDALERGRARLTAVPGWAQALAVYLAARLFTTVVTVLVARTQVANLWTSARPAYFDFVGIWDGDWYRKIAENGYPAALPLDAAGSPLQSEWAFYPAYPALVRLVGMLTGLEWRVAAPTVALLVGAAAAVVLHRLFADRVAPATALVGVAVVAVFPSAPVLQYAYTESMGVLGVALALLLLSRRRYLAALAPVALLGLTRPVALPFAAVVAVHLVLRWRSRRTDPLTPRQTVSLLALGMGSAVAGVAWPAVVGVLLGDPSAYTAAQSAWRGPEGVVLLKPWWSMSRYLLGERAGPVVLLVLVVGFAALLASRRARVMGPELTAWCAAYGVYLLLVLEPYTSLFRYLLLLFPLALVAAAGLRSRPRVATWVGVSLALQVVWIVWLWRYIPPSDVPP